MPVKWLWHIWALVWLCAVPSFAQETAITGRVYDCETQKPVEKAIVTIRNQRNSILYSGTTTKDGRFSLATKGQLSAYMLVVSRMGYLADTSKLANNTYFEIGLTQHAYQIKDVYVRPQKIVHHNDTTSYLVSGFSSVCDRTIGDVLKKMPGIEVSKTGTISYNGKAIDDFMIEGVDLFDGQYNIATRNISHDLISKVDVIENHQSAKALRNSKREGGTAMNLRLKDKAKGRWSGNARLAGGVPELWEGEVFDARLSATNQTSIVAKTNNTGKDIMSENKVLTVDELLNPNNYEEASAVLDLSQAAPSGIDRDRSRRSRSHIVNISNVQKLSSTAILRSKVYYTDDRNLSDLDRGITYYLADSTLVKRTLEHSVRHSRQLSASVHVRNDRPSSFFSDELEYSSMWHNLRSSISGDYNDISSPRSDAHTLTNTLKWILPVGKHHLTLQSLNRYVSLPERLTVVADGESFQRVDRRQFISTTKLNFAYNLRRWALDVRAENVVYVSNIKSNFLSTYIDTTFANDARADYVSLTVRPSLTYKYRSVRAELQMPCSFYHYFGYYRADKVYFLPKLTMSYDLNAQWKVRANMAWGNSPISIVDSYPMPIMTDNKTFRSAALYGYLRCKHSYALAASYANYTAMLFANLSVGQNWANDNTGSAKRVDQNIVYYTTAEGDNSTEGTMILGNLSKGVQAIHGNLNVKCFCLFSKAMITQNGQTLHYNTNSIQTSAGLTAGLLPWMDLDYQLSFIINKLKSAFVGTSTSQFSQKLELSLSPIDDLNIAITAEHYANHLNPETNKHVFFSDVKCIYRYRKIDFTANLTNIFNQRYYTYTVYTDLSSSYQQSTLRGRNLLLGAVVYF